MRMNDEPTHYRIRMLYGQWYVCLYADEGHTSLIGHYGPYDGPLLAEADVKMMHIVNCDSLQEPKS